MSSRNDLAEAFNCHVELQFLWQIEAVEPLAIMHTLISFEMYPLRYEDRFS
jgi:hypothetical protein